MSKGSRPRPIEVPQKEFDSNWDRIFKKKTDEKPTESSELNKRKGKK